ncbi:natural cytotoxicity triggering receptor 3 ligand 1-like, partial [Alligator sinensis]|uniref:Natural cytotoxicity triggering receptor 3 ligand 1-like n=1 Tax=Alligator sinensis TaxID=38654 RepID=A0A3Q0FWD0_ALLSI
MGLGALIVLLLPFLFIRTASSQLRVMTDPSSQALLGAEVRLRCHFEVGGPVALRSLRVTWYLLDGRMAQYNDGRSWAQLGPSLAEKELEKGDASLTLARVMVTDGGLYTCAVGYGAQQQQGSTSLRVLAPPSISIPQRAAVAGAITTLLCHVGGFYPEALDVAWLRDGQVLNGSTRSSPQRNPDGTFSLTLTYTFTPDLRDAGTIFACRARHAALGQPLHEEVPFAVHLHGFYPRGIHRIEWSQDGKGWERSEPSDISPNPDGTFTVTSVWRVPSRRLTGLLRPPALSDISQPESVPVGSRVTLSCCISEHFPAELRVAWLRKGKGEAPAVPLADSDDYRIQPGTAVQAPDGKSFQQETRLIFTPSVQRDQGAQYICRVQHVALEQAMEKRSTGLQVT